jgi:hypothetical protein
LTEANAILLAGYVTPEAHAAVVADNEKLLETLSEHGDDLDDRDAKIARLKEAHAAALREAWEAGRDAAAKACDHCAVALFPDKEWQDDDEHRGAEACARAVRALTPPAPPKGDDR